MLAHSLKKTPHSKALESVCLFRSHLPPIATQSLGREVRVKGTTGLTFEAILFIIIRKISERAFKTGPHQPNRLKINT
jgi:predicted Zn-dependent protease